MRELYNTMQRAVLYSPGTQISAGAVDMTPSADAMEIASQNFRSAKLNASETFERDYVRQMMDKMAGM